MSFLRSFLPSSLPLCFSLFPLFSKAKPHPCFLPFNLKLIITFHQRRNRCHPLSIHHLSCIPCHALLHPQYTITRILCLPQSRPTSRRSTTKRATLYQGRMEHRSSVPTMKVPRSTSPAGSQEVRCRRGRNGWKGLGGARVGRK